MPQVRSVRDMSLALAKALSGAACREAARRGIAVTAVVVDRAGQPVHAERMDGAALCAFPLALAKADTAAATLAASALWFRTTQPGGADWGLNAALAGRFTAMPGGLPVLAGDEIVGAIGVSGGEADQDVACAEAALAEVAADG